MGKRMVAILSLLMLTGCYGTAAMQTIHTVMGPEGQYQVIRQYAAVDEMAKYRAVEVTDFVNEVPVVITDGVTAAVRTEMVKELDKLTTLTSVKAVDRFQQSVTLTPTMVITGRLVDITSDKIPGQKLIGNATHLIARVKVLDKGSGTVLVEANLRGYVHSALDVKQESLATGLARGASEMLKEVCGWKKK